MRALLLLLSVLVSSPLLAQQRVVPKSCVPQTPEKGEFTGVLQLRTYPGPPNYQDTTTGDKPEMGIYLRLDGFACAPAQGDTIAVYTREELEWIQLVVTPDEFRRLRRYLGKPVTVQGTWSLAETGHHHVATILVPSKPLRVTETQF